MSGSLLDHAQGRDRGRTALDRLREALEARDCRPRQVAAGIVARCPAHPDQKPSLSLRQITGQALVFCHAGCATVDVVDALGLAMADLFDEPSVGIRYAYTDAAGRPTRTVHRSPDKRFRQSGDTAARPELYRLPRVLEAVAAGTTVLLVEGEKDVHAAEALGAVATTSPMGASNWSRVDAAPLAGAHVLVIPDNDEPGRRYLLAVLAGLQNVAASVRVARPKVGKDLADHVGAGLGLDDLLEEVPPQVGRRARITWASDIRMRPVVWAWTDSGNGRMPAGSLSVAAGREGTGKSSFGVWLAAQITRGTLPGSLYGKPRRVLYAAVEDSWEHTLAPRLAAAGADLTMVGRFDVVEGGDEAVTLSLPHDNRLLEAAVVDHQVSLVVMDPLLSLISEKIDTHQSRSVRAALDPLALLADRTGALLLGIAHFNKGGGTDPSSLITGSGAFKDVPRSVFGFVRDSDVADGTRVMTQTKNSLGTDELPSLAYVIESATIDTDEGPAYVGRLAWKGTSDRSAQDILRDAGTSPEDRAERADAATWLRDYLTGSGGEAPATDVQAAGRGFGFSADALKRAKGKAGVRSRKAGLEAGWVWALTDPSAEGSTEGSEERTLPAPAPFAPFVLPSGAVEGPFLSPVGPCVSCGSPTTRYGPRGKPRCDTCDQPVPDRLPSRRRLYADAAREAAS